MSNAVIVYKGRDNRVKVLLNSDVSGDTITSEIRTQPSQESTLIAEWDVAFETDGSDGVLILTMDALTSSQIQATIGYMDLKRVSGLESLPVFDQALQVEFRGTVTA